MTKARGSKQDEALSAQQLAFVQFYTRDFNATLAATKAGYSEKTAAQIGYQLLQNPSVQTAINEIAKKNAAKHEAMRARVIEQLALIAFSNLKNYGTFDDDGLKLTPSEDLPDDLASVIQEFKVTNSQFGRNVSFKLASKEKALELLGRHLGMFTDNVKLETVKPFVIQRASGDQLVLGAKVEEEEA